MTPLEQLAVALTAVELSQMPEKQAMQYVRPAMAVARGAGKMVAPATAAAKKVVPAAKQLSGAARKIAPAVARGTAAGAKVVGRAAQTGAVGAGKGALYPFVKLRQLDTAVGKLLRVPALERKMGPKWFGGLNYATEHMMKLPVSGGLLAAGALKWHNAHRFAPNLPNAAAEAWKATHPTDQNPGTHAAAPQATATHAAPQAPTTPTAVTRPATSTLTPQTFAQSQPQPYFAQ